MRWDFFTLAPVTGRKRILALASKLPYSSLPDVCLLFFVTWQSSGQKKVSAFRGYFVSILCAKNTDEMNMTDREEEPTIELSVVTVTRDVSENQDVPLVDSSVNTNTHVVGNNDANDTNTVINGGTNDGDNASESSSTMSPSSSYGREERPARPKGCCFGNCHHSKAVIIIAIFSLCFSVAHFLLFFPPGFPYVNILLGITIPLSICGFLGAYYYVAWLVALDLGRVIGTSGPTTTLLRNFASPIRYNTSRMHSLRSDRFVSPSLSHTHNVFWCDSYRSFINPGDTLL